MTKITSKGRDLAYVLASGVGLSDGLAANCSLICRHARTLHRLDEDACNGHPAMGSASVPIAEATKMQERWEKRVEQGQKRAEARIKELAQAIPLCFAVDFNGDPRGPSVLLVMTEQYFKDGGRRSRDGVDLGAFANDRAIVVPYW